MCRNYAENGIGCVIVTPYPRVFLEHGTDVTTEEGLKRAGDVCAFIAEDYKDIKSCWQITNEMHIRHFRAPLNAEQAKNFIIACAKGFKRGNPNFAVGHNSVDEEWLEYCKEIDGECDCDYTGVDLYDGSWSDGGPDTYVPWLEKVYKTVGKPVILMEFGFASKGGLVTDKNSELDAYAQKVGFADFADAVANTDAFIETFCPDIRDRLRLCTPEDRYGGILLAMPHALKKWSSNCPIPHDEEGQAKFYEELLPKLLNCPFLGGAVLYCLKDSDECFYCGQTDCPCETAWGLIHVDNGKKPAYYAVQKVFKEKNNICRH